MNIRSYLPSRKIRIIFIVIIVVGLLTWLAYFLIQKKRSIPQQNLIDVSYVDSDGITDYYTDTDNDGAYDWEEALYPELDPNNPDSDGDGVLDGKYVQAKRQTERRLRSGGSIPESNLSESEKLGRSTLTALIAIAQSGGDFDDQTQEQFSNNIRDYVSTLTFGDTIYTRDQLLLVEDTKENIYAYRDRMKDLFITYPVATSDIELLFTASENSAQVQGKLRSASKKYNEYVSKLAATDVPYAIAGRHTELLNNVSQINGAVNNLLEDEPDELITLAFLVQVETILNRITDSIVKINTFFEIIEKDTIFQ